MGQKDKTTEPGLLQTQSNQIWDLTLNIYNLKTTWPNATKFYQQLDT
jgi:hypothetical protein